MLIRKVKSTLLDIRKGMWEKSEEECKVKCGGDIPKGLSLQNKDKCEATCRSDLPKAILEKSKDDCQVKCRAGILKVILNKSKEDCQVKCKGDMLKALLKNSKEDCQVKCKGDPAASSFRKCAPKTEHCTHSFPADKKCESTVKKYEPCQSSLYGERKCNCNSKEDNCLCAISAGKECDSNAKREHFPCSFHGEKRCNGNFEGRHCSSTVPVENKCGGNTSERYSSSVIPVERKCDSNVKWDHFSSSSPAERNCENNTKWGQCSSRVPVDGNCDRTAKSGHLSCSLPVEKTCECNAKREHFPCSPPVEKTCESNANWRHSPPLLSSEKTCDCMAKWRRLQHSSPAEKTYDNDAKWEQKTSCSNVRWGDDYRETSKSCMSPRIPSPRSLSPVMEQKTYCSNDKWSGDYRETSKRSLSPIIPSPRSLSPVMEQKACCSNVKLSEDYRETSRRCLSPPRIPCPRSLSPVMEQKTCRSNVKLSEDYGETSRRCLSPPKIPCPRSLSPVMEQKTCRSNVKLSEDYGETSRRGLSPPKIPCPRSLSPVMEQKTCCSNVKLSEDYRETSRRNLSQRIPCPRSLSPIGEHKTCCSNVKWGDGCRETSRRSPSPRIPSPRNLSPLRLDITTPIIKSSRNLTQSCLTPRSTSPKSPRCTSPTGPKSSRCTSPTSPKSEAVTGRPKEAPHSILTSEKIALDDIPACPAASVCPSSCPNPCLESAASPSKSNTESLSKVDRSCSPVAEISMRQSASMEIQVPIKSDSFEEKQNQKVESLNSFNKGDNSDEEQFPGQDEQLGERGEKQDDSGSIPSPSRSRSSKSEEAPSEKGCRLSVQTMPIVNIRRGLVMQNTLKLSIKPTGSTDDFKSTNTKNVGYTELTEGEPERDVQSPENGSVSCEITCGAIPKVTKAPSVDIGTQKRQSVKDEDEEGDAEDDHSPTDGRDRIKSLTAAAYNYSQLLYSEDDLTHKSKSRVLSLRKVSTVDDANLVDRVAKTYKASVKDSKLSPQEEESDQILFFKTYQVVDEGQDRLRDSGTMSHVTQIDIDVYRTFIDQMVKAGTISSADNAPQEYKARTPLEMGFYVEKSTQCDLGDNSSIPSYRTSTQTDNNGRIMDDSIPVRDDTPSKLPSTRSSKSSKSSGQSITLTQSYMSPPQGMGKSKPSKEDAQEVPPSHAIYTPSIIGDSSKGTEVQRRPSNIIDQSIQVSMSSSSETQTSSSELTSPSLYTDDTISTGAGSGQRKSDASATPIIVNRQASVSVGSDDILKVMRNTAPSQHRGATYANSSKRNDSEEDRPTMAGTATEGRRSVPRGRILREPKKVDEAEKQTGEPQMTQTPPRASLEYKSEEGSLMSNSPTQRSIRSHSTAEDESQFISQIKGGFSVSKEVQDILYEPPEELQRKQSRGDAGNQSGPSRDATVMTILGVPKRNKGKCQTRSYLEFNQRKLPFYQPRKCECFECVDTSETFSESISEGEIKCQCTLSAGEIHNCRPDAKHYPDFKYYKRHPEKMIRKALGDNTIQISRQREYYDSWVSYYLTKNRNKNIHDGSSASS